MAGIFRLLQVIPRRKVASKSVGSNLTTCLKHSYANLYFSISNKELPRLLSESISSFFLSIADSKYFIAFLCCFCPAYTIPTLFRISISFGSICKARLYTDNASSCLPNATRTFALLQSALELFGFIFNAMSNVTNASSCRSISYSVVALLYNASKSFGFFLRKISS